MTRMPEGKKGAMPVGASLLAASLVALAGCVPAAPPGMSRLAPETHVQAGYINDEVSEMEKKYYVAGVIDAYNGLAGAPDRQRAYRDEVINGRIYVIDHYYRQYTQSIQSEPAQGGNFVTDIAVFGLDAADAINPARRAKEIILAISGGLSGNSHSPVDKELFYDEAMPALVSKMDALRLERLLRIRQRMRYPTQGEKTYTLGAALIDVNNYFQAGTVPAALVGITSSSGASASETERELRTVTE